LDEYTAINQGISDHICNIDYFPKCILF